MAAVVAPRTQFPQSLLQTRAVPAVVLSAVFSLALFWLLYGIIHVGRRAVDKSDSLQTIDFVRLKRDTQVESLERRKPPPPPPQEPPPPAKMKVASESTQQEAPTPFAMPSLGLSASVGGGPFVGEMGSGASSVAGLFDGDIIPLQRITPQYPRDAARAHLTGWVQLEVMVNADGTVRSARVTDAKPKGLFDSAAVSAVLKWKFKPKVMEGQPVAQRGMQKIEFTLE
jgi:protein TonB